MFSNIVTSINFLVLQYDFGTLSRKMWRRPSKKLNVKKTCVCFMNSWAYMTIFAPLLSRKIQFFLFTSSRRQTRFPRPACHYCMRHRASAYSSMLRHIARHNAQLYTVVPNMKMLQNAIPHRLCHPQYYIFSLQRPGYNGVRFANVKNKTCFMY